MKSNPSISEILAFFAFIYVYHGTTGGCAESSGVKCKKYVKDRFFTITRVFIEESGRTFIFLNLPNYLSIN